MKNGLKLYRDNDFLDNWMDKMYGLDNFFTNDFPTFFEYPRTSVGQVNIRENETEYALEVNTPGFKRDELNIDVKDDVITISGNHSNESKEEKKNYFRKEFSKSSFKKSFTFPKDATGDIDAKLEDGILTILLKKKELPPKVEPKKIEIK